MKALRDAYYAQIVLLNREEPLSNPQNMTTGQQQADPQQTDNQVYQQNQKQSQKGKADIQMPVIEASYPDLGIWVLHLSVLHQQLAPNLEQILYSQWVRDPSQHSHWMDKPSLLKQCCYIWKTNLGRKKSCETVWGLFPFMARLWCIRLFLLMQACKKQQHSKEMRVFSKCQKKKNVSEKTGTYRWVFFLCGEATSLIFTCSFSWEKLVWVPEFLDLQKPWNYFSSIKKFSSHTVPVSKTLWRLNLFVPHWAISASRKILQQR